MSLGSPERTLPDTRGRQTYQLTALNFQPQLSQKHFVKFTATQSF